MSFPGRKHDLKNMRGRSAEERKKSIISTIILWNHNKSMRWIDTKRSFLCINDDFFITLWILCISCQFVWFSSSQFIEMFAFILGIIFNSMRKSFLIKISIISNHWVISHYNLNTFAADKAPGHITTRKFRFNKWSERCREKFQCWFSNFRQIGIGTVGTTKTIKS